MIPDVDMWIITEAFFLGDNNKEEVSVIRKIVACLVFDGVEICSGVFGVN